MNTMVSTGVEMSEKERKIRKSAAATLGALTTTKRRGSSTILKAIERLRNSTKQEHERERDHENRAALGNLGRNKNSNPNRRSARF